MDHLTIDSIETDQTGHELKAIIQRRIEEGLAGKVSTKSVQDVLEEEFHVSRR